MCDGWDERCGWMRLGNCPLLQHIFWSFFWKAACLTEQMDRVIFLSTMGIGYKLKGSSYKFKWLEEKRRRIP